MRGRPPDRLKLKPKAARALQRLVRDGHTPQRVAQRARILLACVQAARLQQVAAKVDQHCTTVWRVCQRYRPAYTMRRAQAAARFFPNANAAGVQAWRVADPPGGLGTDPLVGPQPGPGRRSAARTIPAPLALSCRGAAASLLLLEDHALGCGSG